MTINKRGFSLVELMVVTALFGVMAIVAANFLISTFSSSNRIAIENEVRQNAALVMNDIENEIRKAGCVDFVGNNSLATLTVSDAVVAANGTCSDGNVVIFTVDNSGAVKRNGVDISSVEKVSFVQCSEENACSNEDVAACDPGLMVTPLTGFPTDAGVDVVLSARQKNSTSRVDSCAKISLSQTITPRNSGN